MAQVTGNVDHALEFINRVTPIVVISAAEVEGVIAGKEFRGVNDKAELLLCWQHLIKVDLEVLVAEVDFNKVEIAGGGKTLNVVIPDRDAKLMLEAVGARRGGRAIEV